MATVPYVFTRSFQDELCNVPTYGGIFKDSWHAGLVHNATGRFVGGWESPDSVKIYFAL